MKRMKKICLLLVLIGLGGLALLGGINLYMVHRTAERIAEPNAYTQSDTRADCILVLGARVWEDGSLSAVLRDRVDAAIALYKEGVAPVLLMSGDHSSESYNEVEAMRDYAVEQGVPAEAIIMDHAGYSTYESMYRAKAVYGMSSCIVSTQRYHLYRAVYIGSAVGMDTRGVTADQRLYAKQSYYDIREAAARVKDFFLSMIQPEPAYMGLGVPYLEKGKAVDFGG